MRHAARHRHRHLAHRRLRTLRCDLHPSRAACSRAAARLLPTWAGWSFLTASTPTPLPVPSTRRAAARVRGVGLDAPLRSAPQHVHVQRAHLGAREGGRPAPRPRAAAGKISPNLPPSHPISSCRPRHCCSRWSAAPCPPHDLPPSPPLQEMECYPDSAPSTSTYTSLIDACGRAGEPRGDNQRRVRSRPVLASLQPFRRSNSADYDPQASPPPPSTCWPRWSRAASSRTSPPSPRSSPPAAPRATRSAPLAPSGARTRPA